MGAQIEKQGPYHKKRKMPSVSIIIPAWNEERALKATLHALLEIDYDKKRCEVIVVAGGSDNTYEIAKSLLQTMEPFSGYIVLHQQPAGKNAAIQRGIIEAKNAIIVLLDADTIVTNQWLENMYQMYLLETPWTANCLLGFLQGKYSAHLYMCVETILFEEGFW